MTNMADHDAAEMEETMDRQSTASLLEFGLRYATGQSADLIAAHKWFNLAAMRGNEEAARLRREIAAEMSPSEIAAAQRAARDWLTLH